MLINISLLRAKRTAYVSPLGLFCLEDFNAFKLFELNDKRLFALNYIVYFT